MNWKIALFSSDPETFDDNKIRHQQKTKKQEEYTQQEVCDTGGRRLEEEGGKGDKYSLFGFVSHLSRTQMRKTICSVNRFVVVSAKTSQTIIRKLFTITKHFNSFSCSL